eukprot:TRINITY_DN5830_c0_g1_i1.p2 TRINITY_DN5830_c0_g1~~TRINITY_DN5830_c0_g1_i1.p2  ORF type:complete len:120 (+),score=43.00 TRINITY_DN5830_c0_g1_i1:70-429(+)
MQCNCIPALKAAFGVGEKDQQALAKIDELEGADADKLIDKLFDELDKDKSGVLDGEEFQHFLSEAAKYMQRDLAKQGRQYDVDTLRCWIKQWIDPNGDGKVSRAEMKVNLKGILDAGEA